MTPLRAKMIKAMQMRGFSPRTQQSYLSAVKGLARYPQGKVVYLAIERATKKWTAPIRDWKSALNRFAIEFEDRMIMK